MSSSTGAVGQPRPRLEGPAKVTGIARYAAEYPVAGLTYGWVVQSSAVRGRITRVETAAALAVPGAIAVLSHENAPRLSSDADPELYVLQRPEVAYRGQIVALVVAETLEAAREAARLVRLEYDTRPHSTVLTADHPDLYVPAKVNPDYPAETEIGDFDAGYAAADVRLDQTYRTPAEHNNPMEPHAATARWDGDRLLVHDSTQGSSIVKRALVDLFGLTPDSVRVISPHVGGGFGSKGYTRSPAVLAALGARHVGRPVRLALTRQQLFGPVGYRPPSIQRIRLGADDQGHIQALCHDSISQSSAVKEFAEQVAVYSRNLYAPPHHRTTHRIAPLDVPGPWWMRAPGECPGSFAVESGLDELAVACGIDPVELRLRNDTDVDPMLGVPYSSRNLAACLREGAERFGWSGRDPTPGVRRRGRWLVGTGVASSTYPARARPSTALVRADADGGYEIRINAADIGTGARTALWLLAADELAVPPERVAIEVGDTELPEAPGAGGSTGTSSWGWAVHSACAALRARIRDEYGGTVPAGGVEAYVDTTEEIARQEKLSRYGFGAQFAEVRVDPETGEVRVGRLLGVFAVGRIVNPVTARSQLIGGMTMGLSMALHEEGQLDPRVGTWVNQDLAEYHIPTCADVERIEAYWVEEEDRRVNPIGVKGIGEIGIVGTAAAIASAVYHATGTRVRELPIRLDRLLRPAAS
ncbi:xanthine dehydrogenase family protein molybdopterin-binding subunit [Micromonospora sp. NPDC049559]|uniref:xanthine dehydrogenase family protein molybdopterin-binding subunit n=1 Tax=Micromonospora sp. NPDC049559 TaxID=3155923 RepID=UPI0034414F8E